MPRRWHPVGLLLGDDINKRADGTIRALRLQALLEDDGKYTGFPTDVYIRPDGTHIYMEICEHAKKNVWWKVRGFSGELVNDLDWLKRASPNTAGDRGNTSVCVTRGAMIGYVLTSRGLAAVKGLLEILDPAVEWPPLAQPTKPPKTGDTIRQGEQPENDASPPAHREQQAAGNAQGRKRKKKRQRGPG